MADNPYQAPPNEVREEPVEIDRGPPPTREARLVVIAVLLFASMIVARYLGSDDLYSVFVGAIPIFLLGVIAYYFGLRHGAH